MKTPLVEYEQFLKEHFPDGEFNMVDDQLVIETGLRIKPIDGDMFVISIKEPLPENIVILSNHRKFIEKHANRVEVDGHAD